MPNISRVTLVFSALGILVGAVVVFFWGRYGIVGATGMAILIGVSAFIFREQTSSAPAGAERDRDSQLPALAREVFENLPDPLLLAEQGGRIAFANRAMRALIGIDVERKAVSAVLRTPAVLEALDRSSVTADTISVEFTLHGTVERYYEAFVTRTSALPHLTALLFHDLTATKRAEEARTDFIANASHELRTPLAALSGFVDTLRGHAKNDEAAREQFLGIMSVEASRMRRLIDDLLSLTRIELNEHVPPRHKVDIVAVVKDAAAALAPLAEADRISISIADDAQELPRVLGERDELIQMFQNLIQNAIKYGTPGGHVWISFAFSPLPVGRGAAVGMVSISVKDDGEGIPREAVPRLTERFYRVDVKRSRERGGTGLGLAIVKHLVNRHQGRLQIESHSGEGSTFTVQIPAASEATGDSAVTEVL